jgi:hypothetical protein
MFIIVFTWNNYIPYHKIIATTKTIIFNSIHNKKTKIILGNADFRDSQITDLGQITTIGGNAVFIYSQVTDLGQLTTIGGNADFGNGFTDLGNLTTIGGRADFRDSADQIMSVYDLGAEQRAALGKQAREWVISDEAMMSSRWMSKNVIDTFEETFASWKPRPSHEFIKIKKLPKKKLVHPLTY